MKFPGFVFLACACSLLVLGDAPVGEINLLVPFPNDTVSFDQGKLLIVSVSKERSSKLLVSVPWETQKVVDLSTSSAKDKEGFAKEFYRAFAPNTSIQTLSYSFRFFKGYSKAESLAYAYTDTMTIRHFWQQPAFAQMLNGVSTTEGREMILDIRGWRDSVYTTPYDDPTNDSRALYKIHVQLLPGFNSIYLAPADSNESHRERSVTYTTTYINSAPTDDPSIRFHNSALEQNCTPCHEGLPSSDSGATMKADCSVCHKAKLSGTTVHSPVEMKECTSCHSWSSEKHAVVVEKGVPDVCYGCHDDKKAKVDSSANPHPVAGECLTCHSPHSSNEDSHLLKKSVYDLCGGCHEDKKLNHPVGRHPLRFVRTKNGEVISCVSCHDPHGSPNEHLLTVAGGSMVLCAKCH